MDKSFEEDLKDPLFVQGFISDWNESRLDMFALSLIDKEKTTFSGVMRFYFQDRGLKAVTKAVRMISTQTVGEIMPTLIEKFCPDMKMLSTPNYELFEIHGTGDVRKLSSHEKPLVVQCSWHNEDREGRFVLKSANLKIQPQKFFEVNIDEGQLRRRLSRREKKDLRKKRKEELAKINKSQEKLLADHVYKELPESSLTRTISNPEAVMRRRRQQKLEKRMKEFQNKEGPQTGGILKIFAESLKPEIPYKTILASVKDNADVVTKASLEKFLLDKEDPFDFNMVMAILPSGDAVDSIPKERIIRSTDCPLAIQNSWPKSKGIITFHLRRKSDIPLVDKKDPKKVERTKSETGPFKSNKNSGSPLQEKTLAIDLDNMPFFLELTPDGKEINYKPKIYKIGLHETIIGSSKNPSPGVQYLQLFSPKILAYHCSIVNVNGIVSIVPHGSEADVTINGQNIYENTILRTGNQVQFGGLHTFRFCNPIEEVDPGNKNSSRSSLILSTEFQPFKDMESAIRKNSGFASPTISPELKEFILNEQVGSFVDEDHNASVETTFGVDGEIETNKSNKGNIWSARSAENLVDAKHYQLRDSFKKHRQSAPDLLNIQIFHSISLLPASLSFLDQGRDAFFAAIISEVNGAAVNFKLAPTYTLYLAGRYILSPDYRPSLTPTDRTKMLNSITKRIALTIQQTIQENDCLAGGLAFWMANASELLHFYRQDMDLGPLTQAAQAILAQSIQESFALLVNAMEEELSLALPAFLEPSDSVDIHPADLDFILNDDLLERAESTELLNWTNEDSDSRTFRVSDTIGPKGKPISGEQWITPAARIRQHGMPILADVLYILSSAMSLLRRCRVNAALTIQLFSQLFHYVNMWVFNRIVLEPDLRLCTRLWGHCLRMRLSYIEAWAERQGLELAADCHLARVIQAAHLLEATKETADDIADFASRCFKLNSLQLRVLLENYLSDEDEPLMPQELIDSIVAVAETTSDEISQNDGYEIKLEEDIQLQLPFLLPEEGYSSDIIRGVPPGLQEFLKPLVNTGLCELRINVQSMGLWTAYQDEIASEEDVCLDAIENSDSQVIEELPVERIMIDKGKSGLGLSICAAKGARSDFTGIYIKAVIAGGVAERDGRLEAGDQILSVNENGLVDVTQTQAAKIMGKSGPVMSLEIIKRAAYYHGLSKLVENEEFKEDCHIQQNSIDSVEKSKKRNYYHGDVSNRSRYEPSANEPHSHRDTSTFDDPSQQQRNTYEHGKHSRKKSSDQQKQENYGLNKSTKDELSQQENKFRHQKYHDSDFDEDGNLLSKDEKERLARQRQREIEYEERLSKWESQRKIEEKDNMIEQVVEEEAKSIAEEEKLTLEYEDDSFTEEEQRLEAEAECRYEEEVRRKKQDRAEANRMRKDEERKKKEAKERAEEDAKRKIVEDMEKQRNVKKAEEERLQREEEQRKEKEILERIQWQKEDEEKRLRETEIRKKEVEREEREMLKRMREEGKLRKKKEEKEEIERYERLMEEKKLKKKDDETKEKERNEIVRLQKEQEEKRYKQKDEKDKFTQEIELKSQKENQWIEEDRQEKERALIQKKSLQLLLEDEEMKKLMTKNKEEEKRRQEKLYLIEERRKKELDVTELERRRKEAEEKRRVQYDKEIERWRYELEQKENEIPEREINRLKEEKLQRDLDIMEKNREEEKKQAEATYIGNLQLDKDLSSIDEALREAERIAAEMDIFMLEEEKKIEIDSKLKREKEEQQWMKESSLSSLNKEPHQKTYTMQRRTLGRFFSKENILETNIDNIESPEQLPLPPEDLINDVVAGVISSSNYETNIDSSSEEDNFHIKHIHNKAKVYSSSQRSERDYHDEQRRMQEDRVKRNEKLSKQKESDESFWQSREVKKSLPLTKPKTFRPSFLYKDDDLNGPKNMEASPKRSPTFTVSISRNARTGYSPYSKKATVYTRLSHSSDEEEAPPRPPPPRPVSICRTSARNDFQDSHSRTPSTSSINENAGLNHRAGTTVYDKATPPAAVVNQGVGEPEVLDFHTKMKLFKNFQN